MVCERFLENKVHAALYAAGREAPLRPAGGLGGGGAVSPPSGVRGSAPENFENPENLTHKSSISVIFFNHQPVSAATTEKEKKSGAQIVFTIDRKRNSSGSFPVPMQARGLHETDHWPSPHTVEGENLLA